MTPVNADQEGAPTGAPNYPRQSCNSSAALLLASLHSQVSEALFEQRVHGAANAHESFAGILAEHAASLIEIRDMLSEAHRSSMLGRGPDLWVKASNRLAEEITYIHELAGGTDAQ